METEQTEKTEKLGFMNILIILLSIYVLVALMLDTIFKLPQEISNILHLLDHMICVVFLFDFAYRFYHAKSKLAFMKWGWIDLLASIPAVDALRTGRAFRLIRLLRILRAFKSVHHLVNHVYQKRTNSALGTAAIVATFMIIFASIAILQVEHDPESNILTAEDAIWWAYSTINYGAYGDKYPVTTEGRIIAGILMTTGVALFGTVTAYMASWFMGEIKGEGADK
ncbi:MAG: potassium channel family protein [Saprospiraceae bacterium]|nr:potassium channel family protein [Candidatus Vicinibacter affinis]